MRVIKRGLKTVLNTVAICIETLCKKTRGRGLIRYIN